MYVKYVSFGLCLTLWFYLILPSMMVMKMDTLRGEKE